MKKIYHIAQAAEMINRSRLTIKRWISEGLMEPQRDDRGWIIFTDEDIEKLNEIKQEKLEIMLSGKGADDL